MAPPLLAFQRVLFLERTETMQEQHLNNVVTNNHVIGTPRVSVIIKALNEQKRIAVSIESALTAISAIGGEVILADSCSTDRTVEIAKDYPISIVQLANPTERCCGIGPQLGFQHSLGEYVYILDGDMEFLPSFIDYAVAFLDANPEFAGVGGVVQEMNTESLEYVSRMERASGHMQAGEVDRLDMGGLYRRAAILQVGYFSNRNLHSYEEYDLGVRLRAAGWKLRRLDIKSVRHYGHDADPYTLLIKRWKSSYICGLGELLRAAVGKPHFKLVLQELRELKIYAATILIWIFLLAVVVYPSTIHSKILWATTLLFLPVILMALRKRSLVKAIYSVISWKVNSLGLVKGLLKQQISCQEQIQTKVIK